MLTVSFLVNIAVPLTLVVVMFMLGVNLVLSEVRASLRRTSLCLFVTGFQFALLLPCAIIVVKALDAEPVLAITLIAIAAAPGGTFSNVLTGHLDYDLISPLGTLAIQQSAELVTLKLMYGITPDIRIGLSGRYLETTIQSANALFPNLPVNFRPAGQITSVGYGVVAEYSKLDDALYPSDGFKLDFSGTYNEPSGTFAEDYFKSIMTYDHYRSRGTDSVVAFRLAGCSAPGRVPFYDLCSLGGTDAFRGFNITQFLDNALLSSQIEYRRRLGKRIGIVAFAGAGGVGNSFASLADFGSAAGLGLRYRVSKKFPVDFAVDGSVNDEGESFLYISVGQRF